jgi:type I restriction enzyme M protein
LIVDAKSPEVDAEEGIDDAQLYAAVMRRSLPSPKIDQFCMGSNGHVTIIRKHDSNDDVAHLQFRDFKTGNKKYEGLVLNQSRDALQRFSERLAAEDRPWVPLKPSVEEIKATFQKCHNRIWKRESLLPTAAFYEFTKLIFLKLREDERLHGLLNKGKQVRMKDLRFHTEWIDHEADVSPNPVNSILFHRLTEDLDEQVRKNKKKPIFEPNEQIRLKPSTIRAVVELLQDYDLSEIDEDLNGRMFEVFLSAAVRGKNLGAFFTPRNIVELMVHMAQPAVTRSGGQTRIDTVLDGCCGSGGFLIDVMAEMLHQIRSNPSLSSSAKVLEEKLLTEHIYGIDSNPDIARIARINMFLHGDGGSKIYRADALDKEFHVEEGESHFSRDEVNELKQTIVKRGLRFDVILTNPPFASSYTSKDEHEKRILAQYTLHEGTGSTKPAQSAKSNVLFLARYHDLLEAGGRLAIVLDNSMLNSSSFAKHRLWLRKHYLLRAVIGLPKYSFIQAGAGGVTSILYLEKRSDKKQKQPPVFARSVQYTGISKSGKEISQNDLPDVLEEWRAFEKTGKLYLKGGREIDSDESDELFLIDPSKITDRIDVACHTPSYRRLMRQIDAMGKAGTHEIKTVADFELAGTIDPDSGDVFQYIDIGTIDPERCQIIQSEIQEGTLDELSDRAKIHVKQNDVLFPLSFDSFGKVAIIPKDLDGQLASTGFLVIRNKSYEDAILLWAIVRSEIMQKQFLHVASGYTQRGLSREHLSDLRFPIPKKGQPALIQSIKDQLSAADNSRKTELDALGSITEAVIASLSGPK